MIIKTVQIGCDANEGGLYLVINEDVDNPIVIGDAHKAMMLGTALRAVGGAAAKGRLTQEILQACTQDWRPKDEVVKRTNS